MLRLASTLKQALFKKLVETFSATDFSRRKVNVDLKLIAIDKQLL